MFEEGGCVPYRGYHKKKDLKKEGVGIISEVCPAQEVYLCETLRYSLSTRLSSSTTVAPVGVESWTDSQKTKLIFCTWPV